jgi:hypothetical protein
MNKQISVDIECEELTCIVNSTGSRCRFLSEYNSGAFCTLYNNDNLKETNA